MRETDEERGRRRMRGEEGEERTEEKEKIKRIGSRVRIERLNRML